MGFPGEELLIRLWDTLADKGIGNLLRPWQIRREGCAVVDVRRYELLALAEAEREVNEIRSGQRKLCDGKYTLSLTEPASSEAQPVAMEKSEPSVQQIITTSIVTDTLRKELNVAKAIINAEDELKDDPTPISDKEIDPDWLYRWRDCASYVSSEQLQAIWGRILAGELKSPGSFSLRLMEFIRTLSKEDAEKIERVFSYGFDCFIPKVPEGALEKEAISLNLLIELQSLGVLTGAGSIGLAYSLKSQTKDRFVCLLCCHGKGLLLQHADPAKTFSISAMPITDLGRQVISIGKFTSRENYIIAFGRYIKQQGFDVSLVDCSNADAGYVRYENKRSLPE